MLIGNGPGVVATIIPGEVELDSFFPRIDDMVCVDIDDTVTVCQDAFSSAFIVDGGVASCAVIFIIICELGTTWFIDVVGGVVVEGGPPVAFHWAEDVLAETDPGDRLGICVISAPVVGGVVD